jgi:lysozyme
MTCGTFTTTNIPADQADAVEALYRAGTPAPTSVTRTRQADGSFTITGVYPPCPSNTSHTPDTAALASTPAAAPAPAPPVAAAGGTPNHALDFAQQIVEHWEGCSLTPYHGGADRPDVWTIGWGCISMGRTPVTAATPAITQDQADALLAAELRDAQTSVNRLVTVTLTEYQAAALISFTYNEGITAISGSSLLTLLNGGHVADAAAQFSRWVISNGVRVNGLIRRRGAEEAVFLGKVPYGSNLGATLDKYGDAALAANSA